MIENIGIGSKIHNSVEFLGLNSINIGDHVEIGDNVRFIGNGDVYIGDYSKIFRNSLFISRNLIKLGEVSWIGERSTIDGTGELVAGDFIGVGIGSCLYSHIQHGDVTEGCTYDRKSSLLIGDDVWFVGECFVSPVVVKNKSMAMLGSVIIKDMEENHIYGGNPAKDLTDKIGNPWKYVSLEEKESRLSKLLDEGCLQNNLDRSQFKVVEKVSDNSDNGITYYCLSNRTYTKRNSIEEIKMNKWLFNSKAKFKAAE
jgi:acetyltransferase-like isoleucine patch superfamily enzyme